MRAFWLACAVVAGFAAAPARAQDTGLQQAMRNYPPLIMGANVFQASGVPPRSCPAAGGRVEVKGDPAFEYLGASPANPDLCRVRIGSDTVDAWFGIWLTSWPGAETAYPALKRVFSGRTGDVEAFDVVMAPGYAYHDLIRNEGVEDIKLLGRVYRAAKVSHYREGFQGNIYRSVATVWKDMDSGMILYGTYQHISGQPELDDPIIPTRIAPAR